MSKKSKCPKCDGCGQIADDTDQLPWSVWEELPEGSKAAVFFGLVSPMECPRCHGAGELAAKAAGGEAK